MLLALAVASEFDDFGGASLELAAWELGLDHDTVRVVWRQAVAEGLLEAAPQDEVLGEEMWRVTERGHQALRRRRRVAVG